MKNARILAALAGTLGTFAVVATASADEPGGTVVLNTYNRVMPKLVGDALGPKTPEGVPRVGKNTGVGYMDSQLKLDDSPSAAARYADEVSLLITATRTSNTPVNNNNPSYMQGAFAVVKLTAAGPQLDQMARVDLPQLQGERNWQKPNIVATDKHYLLVAASEDNGETNNPQVAAFVYDKATLAPVAVLNSNRNNSTEKPTNLIELAPGENDNQQYGPHSIARVPGTSNSFVLGVQRNNANAYVMRVTLDEAAGGVSLNVNYLTKVVQNATHCRPEVTGDGYLTSVEANAQPADIGVRVLKFNLETGEKIDGMDTLIAASAPGENRYMVQPNIVDLGPDYLGITYQQAEKAAGRNANNGNGHAGGINLSAVQLVAKANLQPVGAPMMGIAPYARHAAGAHTTWGEDGKQVPALVSLGGSSTGTGKGKAQIIPLDVAGQKLGARDPGKLYEVSVYSDVAGTIVRGKRNPNNQGRGFIYAQGDIPNPGFGKGESGFMPEVKTFLGSAVSGYTNAEGERIAARESIWLSLVPAIWQAGLNTTPGQATENPGGGANGTGALPRSDAPPTDTAPDGITGNEPDFDATAGACSTSVTSTSTGAGIAGAALVLLGLGTLRRRQRQLTGAGEK